MFDAAYSSFVSTLNSIYDRDEKPPCSSRPDLFFPEEMRNLAARRIAINLAKRICSECPIQKECAAYAIKAKEIGGVWGGLTAQERSMLKRRIR